MSFQSKSSKVVKNFLVASLVMGAISGTAAAQSASPALFAPVTALKAELNTVQNARLTQVSRLPTTASVQMVRIDLNALTGKSARIGFGDGQIAEFGKQKVDTRSNNSYTWYGNLPGLQGSAILVVNNDAITGTIHHGSELYHVEPLADGLHALVKVNQAAFPPDHPPSFKNIKPGPMPKILNSAIVGPPVPVDVLVAYTTSAKNAVGDIQAKIQLAIDEANQSYVNSDILVFLLKADTIEIPYSETGKSYETILADFVANSTVANRRTTSGADLSVMLINQPQACGLANAIMANANNAYALVHYNCATGYYSFAHEIGHLQGARHDPVADSSTTPFSYGHGYQYGNSWRTIMAYDCKVSCPRLPYWSNPYINYNGVAMGNSSTSNNARVLNETASTVFNFRRRP